MTKCRVEVSVVKRGLWCWTYSLLISTVSRVLRSGSRSSCSSGEEGLLQLPEDVGLSSNGAIQWMMCAQIVLYVTMSACHFSPVIIGWDLITLWRTPSMCMCVDTLEGCVCLSVHLISMYIDTSLSGHRQLFNLPMFSSHNIVVTRSLCYRPER